MIRLNMVVEGQTEETFVRDVLAPHLLSLGITCAARCVETGRKRGRIFRGGLVTYAKLRKDLTLWMRQDQNPDAYFSTMVDLYRLPDDFPGREAEVESMRRIRDEFPSPELIDDENPPSKRIEATFSSYDKRADGPILAFEIGLVAIRRECAHFHEWLSRLEELGQEA